jgi:rhodanese-related sulfurtransferase
MNQYKTLKNISILFFSFVLIMFFVNIFTNHHYKRANSQVVELLEDKDYLFYNVDLYTVIQDDPAGENIVFIDLRKKEEFDKGHLPHAIHIPFNDLLNKSSIATLKNQRDKTIVFYAGEESTAKTARMLLLSVDNNTPIKVLAGNFENARKHVLEGFDPAFASYQEEKARFDFPRYMPVQSASDRNTSSSSGSGAIPEMKTVTTSVQGGC